VCVRVCVYIYIYMDGWQAKDYSKKRRQKLYNLKDRINANININYI